MAGTGRRHATTFAHRLCARRQAFLGVAGSPRRLRAGGPAEAVDTAEMERRCADKCCEPTDGGAHARPSQQGSPSPQLARLVRPRLCDPTSGSRRTTIWACLLLWPALPHGCSQGPALAAAAASETLQ